MNTENTKLSECTPPRGWIFYDALCAPCLFGRNRLGRLLEARGFRWVPLQTPGAALRLGVSETAFATRMHLLTADGKVRHNADAFALLCRSVWWLWPLGTLLRVPGFREAGRLAYDWFARNRYCFGGTCRLPSKRKPGWEGWFPLLILPLVAIFFQDALEPWVFMWALAFAIYLGCKWLTLHDDLASGVSASLSERLTFLILWPGMSLREFVGPRQVGGAPVARPGPIAWLGALIKCAFGAWLLRSAALAIYPVSDLVRGWVGMIGVILMLHFGTFHLLALVWQTLGFNARPNMRAPLLAKSLADFWGRRWNTSFNVLAERYGFRPLMPWIGPRAALLVVFVISGFIHELVITLPARGGFGLPTLYFALQALGMLIERTTLVRKHRLLNRVFAWVVLLAPIGCLFPPVFVRNVILPMLNTIGAN